MSDSPAPEDLEQNVGEANNGPQTYREFDEPEVVQHFEDPRMVATMNRFSILQPDGIDLGRAIILDREVTDTETILRVKLDPDNPYTQDRRQPTPHLDHAITFNQDRATTSPPPVPVPVDHANRPSFRTLERRNSSPSRLDSIIITQNVKEDPPNIDNSRSNYVVMDSSSPDPTTSRTSYIIVDSASLDPTRPTYVNVDPSRQDYTRSSFVNVDPSRQDYTRSSFVNVDPSRQDYTTASFVNMEPSPSPDPTRPSFINVDRRSSSPPTNDNVRPSLISARRVSSPPVTLNSRPGVVNLHRTTFTSPPGVDSARPSLSVFRFKQTAAANGGNGGNTNLPPRSPSPGRRVSSADVSSSVLKPTYNSQRRSTVLGTVSAEKPRSSSPPLPSPPRRTSVSDVPSNNGPQSKYYSRRRTTTGDINDGKRQGSPLTGRDGKRMSRVPFPGPLGAVVLSWTNLTVSSR